MSSTPESLQMLGLLLAGGGITGEEQKTAKRNILDQIFPSFVELENLLLNPDAAFQPALLFI